MTNLTSEPKRQRCGHNHTIRLHLGFTLIELMLSIAIMAMIASVGVLYLRHQIENARITKTAKEVESTLQAAQTFYSYTGKWPTNNFTQAGSDCVAQDPASNIFIAKYLPNENYQDTFGGHYCWAQSQDPNVQFWVAVKIPLITDATHTINLAKQIAAEIPNGAITSSPAALTPDNCVKAQSCYVKAAVAEGENQSSSNNSNIIDVGVCSPSNGVHTAGANKNSSCVCQTNSGNSATHCTVTFTCPKNTTGALNAVTNNIYMPHVTRQYSPIVLGQLNTSVSCNNPNTTGLVSCALTPLGKTMANNYFGSNTKHPGYIGANYIALCIPSNKTMTNTHWL